VRDFFAEEGGEWPVVRDDDGRIALSYGVTGVPESYLVAPSGLVVQKITGGVTTDGLDRLLASAEAAAAGSAP
jgi:cytochrome c biogenesis protein CcmG/thiol:disulfide interchange protein DsbE